MNLTGNFGFQGGGNGGGGGATNTTTQNFSVTIGNISVGGNALTLANTPTKIIMTYLDGTTVLSSDYSVSGANVTFGAGIIFNSSTIIQVTYQY